MHVCVCVYVCVSVAQVSLMQSLEGDQLVLPMSTASKLVLSNAQFAQQFVAAGGLTAGCVQRLLRETNSPALLVDTLLVR